jgi:hypothetical protein
VSSICTLDTPDCVLVTVLSDRLIFASNQKNSVKLVMRFIRIIEPLLSSILSVNDSDRDKQLQLACSRFDCRFISEKVLNLLEKNGYSNLSNELISESQFSFDWKLRYKLAKTSLNFSYAFNILSNSYFEKNEDDEYCDSNSEFYLYFIELGIFQNN